MALPLLAVFYEALRAVEVVIDQRYAGQESDEVLNKSYGTILLRHEGVTITAVSSVTSVPRGCKWPCRAPVSIQSHPPRQGPLYPARGWAAAKDQK